jgi:hypothetical protein
MKNNNEKFGMLMNMMKFEIYAHKLNFLRIIIYKLHFQILPLWIEFSCDTIFVAPFEYV